MTTLTDLLVITEEGYRTAGEADLKELDELVVAYQKPAEETLKKRLEKMQLAKESKHAASTS